jgi:hypothetical protein
MTKTLTTCVRPQAQSVIDQIVSRHMGGAAPMPGMPMAPGMMAGAPGMNAPPGMAPPGMMRPGMPGMPGRFTTCTHAYIPASFSHSHQTETSCTHDEIMRNWP